MNLVQDYDYVIKHKIHTFSRYDLVWQGYAKINWKYYEFITHDITDYDLMDRNCPCCSKEVDYDSTLCNCESYTNVICVLRKLKLKEIILYYLRKIGYNK